MRLARRSASTLRSLRSGSVGKIKGGERKKTFQFHLILFNFFASEPDLKLNPWPQILHRDYVILYV